MNDDQPNNRQVVETMTMTGTTVTTNHPASSSTTTTAVNNPPPPPTTASSSLLPQQGRPDEQLEDVDDDEDEEHDIQQQGVAATNEGNATTAAIDIFLQQQALKEKDDEDRSRYTINADAMHALFSPASLCRHEGDSLRRMKMIQIITSRTNYPVRTRMIIRVLVIQFLRQWKVEQENGTTNGGIDRLVVRFIDSFRRDSSSSSSSLHFQPEQRRPLCIQAVHALFSIRPCNFRNESLNRTKMMEIITRRTEFPLRQRNTIRSLLVRFLAQISEEESNNNSNTNNTAQSDIDTFVTTFLDSLCRDIFEMITDTRTLANGYRGLDFERDTEAEVATMLRFFPNKLLLQKGGRHNFYPLLCLPYMWDNNIKYNNLKAKSFIPIFAAIAMELNLFNADQRGGILVEDEDGRNTLSSLLMHSAQSSDYRRQVDAGILSVLVRLRQLGLFVKEDIQQYKLVHKLCWKTYFVENLFHFLVQWDPSSLLIEDDKGHLPLHWAASNIQNRYCFRIVFESYITYYPLKVGIGLLFRTRFGRPREMTSIQIACQQIQNNQTATVVDIVENTLANITIKLNMVEALVLAATDARIHVSGTYFLLRRNPALVIKHDLSRGAPKDPIQSFSILGKRSNDMGQVERGDYEFQMEQMIGAPKGPFKKASETVLHQRKIVRAVRNTAIKKTNIEIMPRYSVAESANDHTSSIVPFVFESSLSPPSLSALSNRRWFCRRLHRRGRQQPTARSWTLLGSGTPRPRTRMVIAPASTSIVPNQIPPLLIGTGVPTAPTGSIVTENLLMNKSSSANISNIDDDDEEQQYPSSVVETSFGNGSNITKQAVSDKAGTVVSSSTDQLDSFVVHTVSSSEPIVDTQTPQLLQALSQQIQYMNTKMELLTTEIAGLKMTIAEQQAQQQAQQQHAAAAAAVQQQQSATRAAVVAGTTASPSVVDPNAHLIQARNEVTMLLREHNYEEAFTKAIATGEPKMAVICCANCDITCVLRGGGPPGLSSSAKNGGLALSQAILICLMQILSAALNDTTNNTPQELQIEICWLQEIAICIEPNDASIAQHVPRIVKQLVANVQKLITLEDQQHTANTSQFRRPLQMLLQVLRGIQ